MQYQYKLVEFKIKVKRSSLHVCDFLFLLSHHYRSNFSVQVHCICIKKREKEINFIILCNISLAFLNERKLRYNFCLVEFGECDFKITFKR